MLGILAGVLAGIAIVPTAIPLGWRVGEAERTFSLRRAEYALSAAERMLMRDGLLPANPNAFGADGLLLESEDGPSQVGQTPALPFEMPVECSGIGTVTRLDSGAEWAVACFPLSGGRQLAAFVRHQSELPRTLAWMMFALALIVSIVTTLGILRILAPISSVSNALERVRIGEHGVRVARIGLRELDELVDGINSAASAMEEREDAIRGRIAVVHELARMVAHEVRNPLQSVELLTSLIAAEERLEERRKLMNAIKTEIRNLDGVVTRLLREGIDSSGFRLNCVRRPVSPVLEQLVTLRTPEAHRRGIVIEAALDDSVDANLDTALFARSIENLFSNALQAVPDGRGRIRLSVQHDDDEVFVLVLDNGPGVPLAMRDKIFEPHVTGREDGHGLGLAMVREVIRAHGGTVSYVDSPLGGAGFEVRLPRHERE